MCCYKPFSESTEANISMKLVGKVVETNLSWVSYISRLDVREKYLVVIFVVDHSSTKYILFPLICNWCEALAICSINVYQDVQMLVIWWMVAFDILCMNSEISFYM